jgi:hypothetical protein
MVVAAAAAAAMALLIYLVATQNALGSWILTLALPVAVIFGIVRRKLSGVSVSESVRPAVQGVSEVQDMVLNRPGTAVTYGTSVGPLATEYDPRFDDALRDDPDQRGDATSGDRG